MGVRRAGWVMLQPLLTGYGRIHGIGRQIDLARPDDGATFDECLVEEFHVCRQRERAGQFFSLSYTYGSIFAGWGFPR